MNLKKKNLPVHFLLLQVKMAIFICKRKQEIRQPKNKKKIQSEIASQDSEISLAVHVLEIQKDTYLKLACSLNLEMAIKIMKRKEQVTNSLKDSTKLSSHPSFFVPILVKMDETFFLQKKKFRRTTPQDNAMFFSCKSVTKEKGKRKLRLADLDKYLDTSSTAIFSHFKN